METLVYLLVCALVAINMGWLLFLSVQISRGLEALRAAQAGEQAHREVLQRRSHEAIRGVESTALTAIRELGSLFQSPDADAPRCVATQRRASSTP